MPSKAARILERMLQIDAKVSGMMPHGRRYPWEDWLRMDVAVRLERGVDFHSTLHGFVVTARRAAKVMGYGLKAECGENVVTLKLRPYRGGKQGHDPRVRSTEVRGANNPSIQAA